MRRLEPGDTFTGDTIERLLAADGTGEVYLVHDPRSPHRDVLTIFAAPLTDDDGSPTSMDGHAADILSRLSDACDSTANPR